MKIRSDQDSDKSLATSQSQQPGSFTCFTLVLSVKGKYSFIWLLFAAIWGYSYQMVLNEPSICLFHWGHCEVGLSDGVKCGLFQCNDWYHLPVGKNGRFVWAERGIYVGVLVDLASGARSCLGKKWKKKKKRKKKAARVPCKKFSTAAIIHQQHKKRDKGRNMYFIVFLQQTRGTVVFKKQY